MRYFSYCALASGPAPVDDDEAAAAAAADDEDEEEAAAPTDAAADEDAACAAIAPPLFLFRRTPGRTMKVPGACSGVPVAVSTGADIVDAVL